MSALPERRQIARGLALFGAGACATWLATFMNRRRRHLVRDRVAKTARRTVHATGRKTLYTRGVAKGVAYKLASPLRSGTRVYDDATLADKVKTELFRPADSPKGRVSVNVCNGIVELRGQVERAEDIAALGDATAAIDGVGAVHNLLHIPGAPAKHAPPSDRARR